MDDALRQRLESFLRPLYQDLDGVSRFEEVERVAAIARRLHPPSRELDLLLLFHGLGGWLEKVGNLSRTTLVTGLGEAELRRTAASIRRLDEPVTEVERAVAAALLVDVSGVRGLAERLSRARREGSSVLDVVTREQHRMELPSWLPLQAVVWIEQRMNARRALCRQVLEETSLADLR
jgi:hypothetical protein